MTQANNLNEGQIHQCDVYCNIDCLERVDVVDGMIKVSKIRFPNVIVMSQECDLTQDYMTRAGKDGKPINHDILLHDIIVAPMFNYEHFRMGEQYTNFGYSMSKDFIKENKSPNSILKQNNNPRYQYIEIANVPVPPSVIDFKRFFTINIAWLYDIKQNHYICSVNPLYRERISQRFANFLSRIGLP